MLKNNTFSIAPVTNYHQLGGWKQHRFSLLLAVWHPSHWADIKVLMGEILIFKNKMIIYLTWLYRVLVAVCRIFSCSMQTLSWGTWDLIPRPGLEPGPPALGAWSLIHWTTREVPRIPFSYLFQLPETAAFLGSWPFLHPHSQWEQIESSHHFTLTSSAFLFHFLGPLWWHWVHLDHPK